jgi:hypothetical protein
MTYLATITVVLIMIGNVKLDVLDDQCILMAHIEFEITSDDGCELGCGEDYIPDDWFFATVSASGGGNTSGLLSW